MIAESLKQTLEARQRREKEPEKACEVALWNVGFLLRGLVSEMTNAVEPVEKEILEDMMADVLKAQERLMGVERLFKHRENQREYWEKNPHVLMQLVPEEEYEDTDEDEGAPGVH